MMDQLFSSQYEPLFFELGLVYKVGGKRTGDKPDPLQNHGSREDAGTKSSCYNFRL
jgi:hypothetical protein